MKKIIILACMLTVSVMALAQTKSTLQTVNNEKDVIKKQDTVFTVRLNKPAVQLLFNTLEGFSPLIRRSPDLTALQADEAIKNVAALGAEIYRQIKPQLPEQLETVDSKKTDKSPK